MHRISSIFVLLLVICTGNSYSAEIAYREFLSLNAANISRITIGMSEADVINTMGSNTSQVKSGSLNNPWKIERSGDAAVYHYLTSKNPPFTPILEHQATPVLIKNGKVIGIGRAFLKDFRNSSTAPTTAIPSGKSIEERMATLKNLLNSGAIDKATYEKQKQKILDEI